jgi:hypothetical protein
MACVSRDDKWGFIDNTGKILVALLYEEETHFTEGLAVVKRDGRYGYVDGNGKEIVKPAFDQLQDVRKGIGSGRKGNVWIDVFIPKKSREEWYRNDQFKYANFW